MKKVIVLIVLVSVFCIFSALFFSSKNDNKEISNNIGTINNIVQNNEISNNIVQSNEILNNEVTENEVDVNTIYIKINNKVLNIELEDNSATRELKERLKNGDIIVDAQDYGEFEKVGKLGFSLPREDSNITTSAGDIVLYQGNQISLFYNSNSWSYTKLGKIQNVTSSELKSILGNGDVTITFTLSQ